MITYDQAMTATRFHESCELNSRGEHHVWRRNGKTQTWKTRPGEFRIPVKWGLRGYGNITHLNAEHFHVEEECPLNKGDNEAQG